MVMLSMLAVCINKSRDNFQIPECHRIYIMLWATEHQTWLSQDLPALVYCRIGQTLIVNIRYEYFNDFGRLLLKVTNNNDNRLYL